MTFDDQAKTFETRAGLSESTCRVIVQTALDLAGIKPGEQVVEVGAGTGQIGQWFAAEEVQYLGFDLSAAMLEEFQLHLDSQVNSKNPARKNTTLLQGDANQQWFVGNNQASLIFSSRTLHLLDLEHVVQESLRIAHPERATVLIGSVQRDPQGVKSQMRKQMQTLLAAETLQGRQKKRLIEQLIKLFIQQGAIEIKPVAVSQWQVASTPRQSLESWRGKANLAGIELDEGVKQHVLDQLQAWAEAKFGDLDQPIETAETYLLQGVRLN
ncbi:MAG: class I SAM-dependent methyltransferase [Cyanobacteria bacterium J06621_8]